MIRALFLLLLLVNLGLFAWFRWYTEPAASASQPAAPLTAKPLQLISELSPAERKALGAQSAPAAQTAAAPSAATAAAAVAAPGMTGPAAGAAVSCASYGPFPSEDAERQAENRLRQLGAQTNGHLVAGRARLGYWVYLPPFSSRQEADAAAALLHKRGLADLYVVTDEANRNAISLGVYNQRPGAEERLKQIRKHGFKAVLTERFRDEPRYWLDARAPATVLPAADVLKDLGEDGAPIGRATCS